MTKAPSSYPYVPLPDRRPLRFPGRARLALIITINIEYWEERRPGMKEPLYPGGPATIPYPLPGEVIDFVNWTWREYGQRIGIWRMMDVFDQAGVAPSCTLNAMIAVERRRIVDAVRERGWELVPHNWVQTELLSDYALEPEKERALIRRTLDEYEKAVGRPAKAWLSSSLRATLHTPAFLKEFGLVAFCDYLNDDQPYLIDTVNGPIVCVPYSNDLNDFNLFARGALATGMGLDMLKLAFDRLYKEGEATGRIMNVGLHPHVIGQPHRIGALEDFLAYAKSQPHVWFPTREEIATWYLAHHAEHIPPVGSAAQRH